jgi:hypothetical protein
MVQMDTLLMSSSKTIATRDTIFGVAALQMEQDFAVNITSELWMRLAQKRSNFELIRLISSRE